MLEILLLSVGAGLLGTWIVLRGIAFYAHAVGDGRVPRPRARRRARLPGTRWARSAAALVFAFGVGRLARGRRDSSYDSLTALVLVGALAGGVILASDVFHSGAEVDSLLFGSLLAIGDGDLALAAAASAVALAVSTTFGRRWLAIGFDPSSARALAARPGRSDAVLLVVVALAITSALAAIGALLATALYVVPAATTRLWTTRLRTWQAATVGLAAVEGVGGLWLSVEVNVPPGRRDRRARGRGLHPGGGVAHPGARSPARHRSRRPAAAPARVRRLRLERLGPWTPDGRRDDDPDRRLGRASSAAGTSRCTRSCSRTPTRTSTSRARRT